MKASDAIDVGFAREIVKQIGDHIDERGGSRVEAMMFVHLITAAIIGGVSQSNEMDEKIVVQLASQLLESLKRARAKPVRKEEGDDHEVH